MSKNSDEIHEIHVKGIKTKAQRQSRGPQDSHDQRRIYRFYFTAPVSNDSDEFFNRVWAQTGK